MSACSCCTDSPATRHRCGGSPRRWPPLDITSRCRRLPGHGTTVDDMLDTGWADWTAEVAAAYRRLAGRVDTVVVIGLSMGGSADAVVRARRIPSVAGTRLREPGDDGAARRGDRDDQRDGRRRDRDRAGDRRRHRRSRRRRDRLRRGTPCGRCCRSMNDGLVPMADRFGELTHAAAADHVPPGPCGRAGQQRTPRRHVGGDVEHVWLERSYHVATQDYDADDINRLAASSSHASRRADRCSPAFRARRSTRSTSAHSASTSTG